MTSGIRTFGQLLMVLGGVVGAAVGVALLLHISIPGVSWIVAVGMAKLALASSVGLMAGGATLQRIASRQEQRHPELAANTDEEP